MLGGGGGDQNAPVGVTNLSTGIFNPSSLKLLYYESF